LGLGDFEYTQNCIIVGDFNTIMHLREKRGGSIVRDTSRKNMEHLIPALDLIGVPPIKGKFTWNNRRVGPGHIPAKLDCFLISSSFLSLPNSFSYSIFPWACSDHHPISLYFEKEENLGLSPSNLIPFGWRGQIYSPLFLAHGFNVFMVPLFIFGNIN